MDFKIGDKVVWRNSSAGYRTQLYTVEHVDKFLDRVGVSELYGLFPQCDFKHATPKPETELRLCESRRDIVVGRVRVLKQEEMSLKSRIHELQQAIKERDKPKGRVGVKDSLAGVEVLWLAHCNGGVYKKSHLWATQRPNYIRMGVVFYDHQSAERYVHDRKQAVLRGDV